MSRLEWILGILLGVLLIVTLIMAAILVGSRESAAPAVTDTALQAYAIAQPVAQAWAGDAALVTMMGSQSVEPGAPLIVASWSLIFYSQSGQATALISVVGDRATLVSTRSNSPQRRPGDLEQWTVSSQAVIEQTLQAGGQEFIRQEGASNLSLLLNVEEQVVWKSTLSAPETGKTLSLWIDAHQGELLDIRQSQ
jgi:hypothetical protein